MGNILPLQVEYRTLVSIQISPLTLPIKKLLSFTHMEHSMSWYYSCCFNHHTWFRIHEKRDSLLNLLFPCPPPFFIFAYCIIISTILKSFPFCLKDFFKTFFKVRSTGNRFSWFPSSKNVFFSSSYLKDIFVKDDSFFFLSTLEKCAKFDII